MARYWDAWAAEECSPLQTPKEDSLLYDQDYRFLIVHFSALDKKKAQTIEKNLFKTQEQYDKDARALVKKSFYCEADAKSALEEFWRKLKVTIVFILKVYVLIL